MRLAFEGNAVDLMQELLCLLFGHKYKLRGYPLELWMCIRCGQPNPVSKVKFDKFEGEGSV